MKTKYKFIYFIERDDKTWQCINNKYKVALGYCIYYKPWKEYEFLPHEDCGFTYQCLLDIADFLTQLNKEKK